MSHEADSSSDLVPALEHVDQYLQLGQQYDCSDVHLPTDSSPHWRRFGQLQPIWPNAATLTAADCERLAYSFLGPKELCVFDRFRAVSRFGGASTTGI